MADLEQAVATKPDDFVATNALASLLVDAQKKRLLDPARAVKLATRACELSEWQDPICLQTLSDAHRACGNQKKADDFASRAAQLR